MTYEEIVKQFIEFGEHVHIVQGGDLETVALHVVPVAWFVAMIRWPNSTLLAIQINPPVSLMEIVKVSS
jgi:hypothetical protein